MCCCVEFFLIYFGLLLLGFTSKVIASTECDSLSYFSQHLSKCLNYVTEYSAYCYEDNQCTKWIEGVQSLKCINNRCLCQEGYRWYQGKCQKYVKKGEVCTTDNECFDELDPLALKCDKPLFASQGTCKCSSDYYDRGNDCRFKSAIYGDCAIADDCKPITFALINLYSTCGLGTCVATKQNEGVEDYMEEYYKDVDVTPTISQYLLNYIVQDKDNSTETDLCPQGVSKSNSKDQCTNCTNAMWFQDSICICKPGFFLKNGNCIAELGMEDTNSGYTMDKDCPIKPGKLKHNTCYCKNYWFNDYTNRNCIKTTLQVTKTCLSDTWCRPLGPYSFCNTTTGQCQCDKVASFNKTAFYCDLVDPANVKNECLKDTNCPINEKCRDEQCACVDNFMRIDGTCQPEIGGSCEFRNCSHIPDAFCSNDKKCQCSSGFVSDTTRCLAVAHHLFDDCDIQNQCQDIAHAVCGDYESQNVTKKGCICDSDYVNVNGTCFVYKTYGSTCSTRSNCTTVMNDSVQCRNSICQCPVSKAYKDGYCSAALGPAFDNHQIALFVVVLAWFLCKF